MSQHGAPVLLTVSPLAVFTVIQIKNKDAFMDYLSIAILVLVGVVVSVILWTMSKSFQGKMTGTFESLGAGLAEVHQSLGAIKSVAADVDRFKRLFENVQAKGALGELVLESILQSFLSKEQWEANVQIKKGSRERVDFAIKIPSKEDPDKYILLPVDSKFRLADYQRLIAEHDVDTAGNADELKERITKMQKALGAKVESDARSIFLKYIEPPKTTPYAIMFLPNDKMFVETLNIDGLFEKIHQQSILITSPTTLAAFISSLNMGFKCLAVERKTGELLDWYNKVENEIGRFVASLSEANVGLQKAQSSLQKVYAEMEKTEKSAAKFQNEFSSIGIFTSKEPLVSNETDTVKAPLPIGDDEETQ